MKLDFQDDDDDVAADGSGLFRYHHKLMQLERRLFAHVREVGDLRALSAMEQVLYGELCDELDNELALDLSRILVARVVERVIDDPERDISSVPHGISRAERMAAFFEPDCPFCRAKVDLVEPEPSDEDLDCECCAMTVREWRDKHADALRQFARPETRAANSA
jgi:hypothetical protein